MFVFNLYIFYKWQDKRLIERLKKVKPREGLVFHWKKIEDSGKFSLPKDRCTLIITDDEELITKVEPENPFSAMAYGGDPKYAGFHADYIDQFWGYYPDEILERMFAKLVNNMYVHFRAYYDHTVLTTIMDSSADMMWVKDVHGIHLAVNKKFTEVVGKTKEQCRGATHNYIWNVPEDNAVEGSDCSESESEVIRHGEMMTFEELVQIGNDMKQLTTYKAPIFDPFGNIVGTSGIGHDITDFNNMGLELAILLENLPLPIILCDNNFNIIRINDRFRQVSKLKPQELVEMHYLEWKKENLIPVTEPIKDEARYLVSQEFRMMLQGQDVYFLLIEQAIHDYFGNVSGYYCVCVDMTVQRQYEQTILEAANTDALTGLYNRRYFYDYVAQNIGKPMSLLYIDLDHFKCVNDKFGHAKGDEVLKETALFIMDEFPESTVARLGGDEYAVLVLDDVDEEKLKEKCNNVDKKVRGLFTGGDFYVSASIGVVQTDGKDVDADALIHEGDVRMYEVKKHHHNEK